MSAEERQTGEPSEAAADWVTQTRDLTQAWTEAQSRIWTDWLAATRPAADVPGRLMSDWVNQWQTLARTSLASLPADAPEPSRELAERLLSGEQAFLGFFEMTTAMMKAVAPAIDVGEDWINLLRRFLDQMKDDMLQGRSAWMHTEALAGVTGEMSELWRLYSIELQRLYGPWTTAYADAARNMAEAGRGDPTAMRETYAGLLNAYEVTFGRFLSAPSVGFTRESSERLLRSFDAWVDMNRAAVDFQTEIANEGMHAVEALIAKLVDMGEKGEEITSLRQFFDLWSETVDSVYYKLFGSDSFANLQGRFVNSAMEYRRRQAELLDEAMDSIGLPGRREVDQIHRRVHELRREVRGLKREMSALRAELAAREAAGEPAVPPEPAVPAARRSRPGAAASESATS
jgi:class III poly(R)-hydroxyalkanoic acid synthase PhaE subunit